jgi:hypothetical protein
MKEKDIENLIALYPHEFFPKEHFKLKGQQVKLGRCYADILFTDKYDRQIIIEVKRGILSRDAAGQLMEYYGLLKQSNPDAIIELILCANTIPHERKLFLENIGIECQELGLSMIQKIAAKYKYTFLDQLEQEDKQVPPIVTATTSKAASNSDDSLTNVWIFQADPKRYDILNALSDPEVQHFGWQVNQHKKDIKKGDVALIWMSGKDAGIYSVADIASNPAIIGETPAEAKYWVDDKDRGIESLGVLLENRVVLINEPIYRDELKQIAILKRLSILNMARGTNFPVAADEWQAIKALINTRSKTAN